ncbi:MAG: M42 family metallopeptidase [bacterium]|nr:M42 family metallopeptidase [bacterium]MDD5757064.1 M42 family metallopeptidase [bacterium]
MDAKLKEIIEAAGVSGYESGVAGILKSELERAGAQVNMDNFGSLIAKKGSGQKKIMLAAHMDEIGLMVKCITKEGYIHFIKIGGIDDRILPAQRVVIKAREDVFGIIGSKPPHLQKDEERKSPLKYEDMFIDIGSTSKEEAEKRVAVGDTIIFEPNAGLLQGPLYYGKAIDNRIGCYAMIKIMERINVPAIVYGVATSQEEVGLKGAKTSSFGLDPDFAIVLDTTLAGDTPGISEKESALKLGGGVAITIIEASGRGTIVNERMKKMLIETAQKNKIKYQIDVIEGGVTDGATISLNREGILTGILSIPTRYIHSPTGVFSMDDLNSAIELGVKTIERLAAEGI